MNDKDFNMPTLFSGSLPDRIVLCLLFCIAVHTRPAAQSVFDSLYPVHTTEIYFESGKSALQKTALATLDSAVTRFKSLPGEKSIRITAHTDSVGTVAHNEVLARQRAESVQQQLLALGIPEAQIIAVHSFGERQPAESNRSETGRQRNRRATVAVARVVPMAALNGLISNAKTGEGIPATVVFRSKTRTDSTHTDERGMYQVRLPQDSIVKIEAIARNYFFQSTVLKILNNPKLYQKYKKSPDIALPPATLGEKIALRDLFFVGDEAVLLESSKPELPKILRFMQINPDLHIEIAGHINLPYPQDARFPMKPGQTPAEYVFSLEPAWRQRLSTDRAKTIYNYLLKNGIPAGRMTYKGYDNREMLFPHAVTNEEMEQNRRVEIRITGKE